MNAGQPSRVTIDPKTQTRAENYHFLISAIVPRPIAWVSSRGGDGSTNLAPFSFFQGVCADPPTLMISLAERKSTGEFKDTLSNIRQSGEFVVNVVPEALAEPMIASSEELPAGESEIEREALSTFPGQRVQAPCIADSPVNLECRLVHQLPIGSCVVFFGEIVLAHVQGELLDARQNIDPEKLRPLARMGGSFYLLYSHAIRFEARTE